VRSSPTPSAPAARAAPMSPARATLAATSTTSPSRVTAGRWARCRASASSLARPARRFSAARTVAAAGATVTVRPRRRAPAGSPGRRRATRAHSHDRGDAQRPRQDRAVRRGTAERAGHAPDPRPVETGGLRRAEVGRHDDALGARARPAGASSRWRRTWSATSRRSAARARRYGSSSESHVATAACTARPRPPRVAALPQHLDARRTQQALVVEEQQVSIEDGGRRSRTPARPPRLAPGGCRRRWRPGPAPGRPSRRRGPAPGRRAPRREPRPAAASRRRRCPATPAARAAPTPPRERRPALAPAARRRTTRGRGRGRSSGAPQVIGWLAEALVGQAPDRGQGLGRLRPAGAHQDLVAVNDPRVATALRLRALTGPRPAVRSASVTSASKPAAVRTSSAAGRACSPSRLATTSRRVGPGRSRRSGSPPARAPTATPGARPWRPDRRGPPRPPRRGRRRGPPPQRRPRRPRPAALR